MQEEIAALKREHKISIEDMKAKIAEKDAWLEKQSQALESLEQEKKQWESKASKSQVWSPQRRGRDRGCACIGLVDHVICDLLTSFHFSSTTIASPSLECVVPERWVTKGTNGLGTGMP